MAKQWTIKDSNGNSIGIVANSKYEAKQQYLSMIKGAEIVEITDSGKVPMRKMLKLELPGVGEKFKPVAPIESKDPNPGPNKPCACGSGRKYKKCCMRKDAEESRSARA